MNNRMRVSGQQQLEILAAKISNQPFVGSDDRVSERPLGGLKLQHFLFHCVTGDQAKCEYRARLTNPMRAIDRLRLDRRIPPGIEEKHVLRGRQVETESPGLQADQKDWTAVVLK